MKQRTLFLSGLLLAAAAGASAQTLRLMTFNVRYPASGDGPNRWELRRDLFVETVRSFDPDLLGTQELFELQGQYIVEKLPEYTWFGISRRGNHEDEHMGVFYKTAKLRLVESGNFWLSETPDVAGSMSWNVALPRMVTWGLFEIKATGRRFYHYNTHLPNRAEDADARLRGVRLIAERAARLPRDVPFILTGDFNAPAGGEAFQLLEREMKDAWSTAPFRFGPEGTNSGFSGSTTGRRIDWVFLRGAINAVQAHTVTLNTAGRYPSDHFPVFTILQVE